MRLFRGTVEAEPCAPPSLLMSLCDQYWAGWFTGISKLFVELTCPRLLVLGDWDRMDATLIKAQMEGKYDVQVGPSIRCIQDGRQSISLTVPPSCVSPPRSLAMVGIVCKKIIRKSLPV